MGKIGMLAGLGRGKNGKKKRTRRIRKRIGRAAVEGGKTFPHHQRYEGEKKERKEEPSFSTL